MSQSKDALVARIDREWNTIRGRMLGLIESWGLPTTQEAGAKSSFKALSSDAQARLATLIGDDALREQMSATAAAIAELTSCRSQLEGEIALSDPGDRAEMNYAEEFVGQRLDTLREHLQDLERLERIQRSLGAPR
jgi:hypothetical protein